MKNIKILALVIVVGLILVWLFKAKILGLGTQKNQPAQTKETTQNDSPKIVSTKPEQLDDSIVSATEVLEITFDKALENSGEFKARIEPKIDFKVELSSDRKTAKIMPAKALELGASYTLFIGSDTKFDGIGAWGQEKTFHFRTVKYTGV